MHGRARGGRASGDDPIRRGSPSAPPAKPVDATGSVPYVVGVINHRTYEDLERCLASVKLQTRAPEAVLVVDVDADSALHEEAARRHPEVHWWAVPNRGFGAGANQILRWARREVGEVEHALILNPDVELRPDFAAQLLGEMQRHGRVALASGKLLRPDGRTLDSAGIVLPRHRRPRDRGSEEQDRGQYERSEFLFAVTGAAVMVQLEAAEDLAVEGEVFDEDFFLYHEDTDLSWRANLLGWRVLYAPSACAIHGRRWRRDGRFRIPPWVRRHSFKNYYLSMLKNERGADFLRNLPVILAWEMARLGYALLRDPAILGGYRDAWRERQRMWHKRQAIQGKRARRGRSSEALAQARWA